MNKPEENTQYINTRYFRAIVDEAYEILEVHKGKNGNIIYSSNGLCYGLLKDFDINGEWIEEISVIPRNAKFYIIKE